MGKGREKNSAEIGGGGRKKWGKVNWQENVGGMEPNRKRGGGRERRGGGGGKRGRKRKSGLKGSEGEKANPRKQKGGKKEFEQKTKNELGADRKRWEGPILVKGGLGKRGGGGKTMRGFEGQSGNEGKREN